MNDILLGRGGGRRHGLAVLVQAALLLVRVLGEFSVSEAEKLVSPDSPRRVLDPRRERHGARPRAQGGGAAVAGMGGQGVGVPGSRRARPSILVWVLVTLSQ